MSVGDESAPLAREIARLEELARSLEGDSLTPLEIRDLADEALAIAQRVAGLLADARDAGSGRGAGGDAPFPADPTV